MRRLAVLCLLLVACTNEVGEVTDEGDEVEDDPIAAAPQDRIDYLFWADSKAGASRHGFMTTRSDGRLGRSDYYGSDHRVIYGDALIP